MGNRKLIYYGNPLLRQKCQPVETIDANVRDIVSDMLRIVHEHDGAGLSAPQVGELLRIFVTRVDSDEKTGEGFFTPPRVCINPKIEIIGDEAETTLEGCLSVPKVYEDVTRPYRVRLTAIDLDGKEFTEEAFGYRARNIIHENDHLNGVLHIDRLAPRRKQQIAPILKRIKKKFS